MLLIWQPWKGDDARDVKGGGGTSGGGSSASPFRNGRTDMSTGTGRLGTPGTRATDTDTRSVPRDSPAPRTSSAPAPDRTEEAFKAVSVGDCLPVYDTGRRGTSIDWSADMPKPVSCGSDRAGLVRVTSTSTTGGDCPRDTGKASWTYRSAASGKTTRLCVTRIYRKHYCMLGEQSGDRISIGAMTAVDCRAQQVPSAYNQVMHILGVYRAPAGAGAGNCRQGASDRTRYWAWLVDGGDTLLCTTIYRSG